MSDDKRKSDRIGLEDAYALSTPDDNRALYRDWADSYDDGFVASHQYIYHIAIAGLLDRYLDGTARPASILDVGCGTGLVGQAIRKLMPDAAIDGVDISPEMLDQARGKGVYRHLAEADLTRPDALTSDYDAVVSAGIFTHGHLGPEVFDNLVTAGGFFVIGINDSLFVSAGFDIKLNALQDAGTIYDLKFEAGPVYGPGATHDHAGDRYRAAIFRSG